MENSGVAAHLRAQVNQVWNVIVSQLGSWNTDKVAAIDQYEFHNLFKEGQAAVLNEFSKFLGNLASVVYSHNLAIFGPKTLIESERFKEMFPDAVPENVDYDMQILVNDFDINEINNPDTRVRDTVDRIRAAIDGPIIAAPNTYLDTVLGEDFFDRHQLDHGAGGRGPRRPPNAFILYRKDKALKIKKAYPRIRNNEISVMVGALWRNESERVRQAYLLAADTLKERFHAMHPTYRYTPRRPSQIQRRAPRNTRPVLATVRGSKSAVLDLNMFRAEEPPTEIDEEDEDYLGYQRSSYLPATIQSSTVIPDQFSHTLPINVQDAIYARFPGVTNVHRGPVQTAVVQDLPFLEQPFTTFITNDNLRDLVAAHGSISSTPETMLGSLSLDDTSRVGANTEQVEVSQQAFNFSQAHMDEFVDFNAIH